MNLTLYCNSFNGKKPLKSQCNQKVLMCGASKLSKPIKEQCINKNYLLDDIADNISDLNYLLGDITGLYWVWKNTDDEFVGTNQYRRFYEDIDLYEHRNLQENTLYVSHFVKFPVSVWQQYIYYHGEIGLKLLNRAIELQKIPITMPMSNEMYTRFEMSTCNSFFAHRTIFNKVCTIFMEIIFELYHGSKYLLDFVQYNLHFERNPNDKRLLAFLGERILNIIYFNCNYFLGDVKIVPIRYYTHD